MAEPLRILVVEDEMTIALMIEDLLTDLGHDVVDVAMRLPQALQAARTAAIDFAVLDLNLDGEMSFPVADILVERGVPFVFASGYGARGLEGAYQGQSILQKPFLPGALAQAIEAAAPR